MKETSALIMLTGDGTDMTIKIIWQSNFPYKLVELIMYDAYGAQFQCVVALEVMI